MTQALTSLEEKIRAAALAEAKAEWLGSMRLNAANAIHFLAQFFVTKGVTLEAGAKGILPGAIQIPDPQGLIFDGFKEAALDDTVRVNVFALLAQMESGFIAHRSAELTETKTQSILAAAH